MASRKKVLCASASFIVIFGLLKNNKKKSRRWWQTTLFKNRNMYSGSLLLKHINAEPKYGMFHNFCRMSATDFEKFVKLAIPPAERLAVTLRFLATGNSYHSLMYTFKISRQCISNFIPEVCDAIIKALKDNVKKVARKSASVFQDTRKTFAEFFKNEGKISWQEQYE
ncbi:hypothetical protein NQ318_010399 [Aromia moschata]|uniref:Protein ANTAGONIST OF LIKE HETEROCHROMATIN PROTEIN 1-like n=1 Tax=Aromia moschata TaxID=1265417 RepID=A0AAV8Y581_9CUCU|nr:hypothetical protein NQ318_010399 [Aromia moschata]